jgi:hypothetical protein
VTRGTAIAFVLVAIGASLASCSKPGEAGSCYREHDNACIEYTPSEGAAGKRLCSGMKWTSGAGSCPSASRVGTCIKATVSEQLYGGAPNNYTPASAKTACEHGSGTFTTASASTTPSVP